MADQFQIVISCSICRYIASRSVIVSRWLKINVNLMHVCKKRVFLYNFMYSSYSWKILRTSTGIIRRYYVWIQLNYFSDEHLKPNLLDPMHLLYSSIRL